MDLLTPAALWALVALAIVFLLPRLRVPRKRLRVSNAFLWREALTSERPRFTTRVKRSLLLILQACAVAALVFSLAEPVLLRRFETITLIVDTSASMGAREGTGTRMDAAQRAIRERLASLPFGSRVRLMLAGPSVSAAGEFSASGAALGAALDRIEPTAGTAPIADAVAAARVLSGERILVVTDADAPQGTQDVEWIAVGSPAANVAISTLSVRQLTRSPLDAELLVEIRNFGHTRSTTLVLREDQHELHRATLRLDADETQRLVVPLRQPAGVLTASIDADDALRIDNVRFALPRARPRVPVTLVSGAGFFLEKALTANPAVELQRVRPEQFNAATAAHRVIVCDGCRDIPDGTGGVMMIAAAGDPSGEIPLDIINTRHPLTASLTQASVKVRHAANASAPADATVLARAGGGVAIAVFERNRRRIALVAIDLNGGAFPTEAAFPILVAHAVEWLASGTAEPTPAGTAGAPGVYTTSSGARFAINAATDTESDLRATRRSHPSIAGVDELQASSHPAHVLPLTGILLVIAALVVAVEWRAYCRARTV